MTLDRSLKTSVNPDGRFVTGLHRPCYKVVNNRMTSMIMNLGVTGEGEVVRNEVNFIEGDIHVRGAQPIYEIPNAFPFWGTTYILGDVAKSASYKKRPVFLGPSGITSFGDLPGIRHLPIEEIPRPVALAMAQTCTSPELLVMLLPLAARFQRDKDGAITGIEFEKKADGSMHPKILDHDLYETLGNNPALPDPIKQVMLLRPGVQGTSPIVGEYIEKEKCHIYEYLRANSYIPWGHYAANMAEDSIRYSVRDLDMVDISGLRHLYYQRIYSSLAMELGIGLSGVRGLLSVGELERLRKAINSHIKAAEAKDLRFTATLWGWNYGYDFSPSGYRLHASHQQIHQQFALVPESVPEIGTGGALIPSYAVGDMVASFIKQYEGAYGRPFFDAYIEAILTNERTDGTEAAESDLYVYKDENVMLFVPKAQRFHGELHAVSLRGAGNILEADPSMRESMDRAIFIAVRVLEGLGARMITSFELSKRFASSLDQRLMYCFIPRHPQSPGAFSEQQSRWITGHFPEDFARSCRDQLKELVQ